MFAPATIHIGAPDAAELLSWVSGSATLADAPLQRAVGAGIRGGALYDSLIAGCALAGDAELLSADRRALSTYRAIGARATLIEVAP